MKRGRGGLQTATRADREPGVLVRSLTIRSIVVGTLGAFLIGVGVPYGNMIIRGSPMASYFNTPAAIFFFFILVAVINVVVGVVHRPWMLRREELAMVYIMLIVATSIPEWGFTAFLLPDITSVIYYATPENRWAELLHPYIPDWIIPAKDLSKIKGFYEGAPKGTGIPWELWLPPVVYWVSFALALYLVMTCMMVVLRKQWIERERLIFPLVQVPIAMIQDRDETRPSLIKPFFLNPLMWLGFLIPTIVQSINALHHYYWFFPRIRLGTSIPLFRKTIAVPIRLSFQMLGFSYFINRDIAFGLCFFYLLNTVEQGIFNIIGLQKIEPVLGVYSRYTGSIVVHQAMGALIVLVLFGLWMARSHLKQVFKKAFTSAPEVDDSGEILSYRGAVFGMIGGLVFMGLWLWQSGLPGWITPIYLFFAFVLFIGITRVVAEGGVAFIFAPMIASDVVASGFGTRALGPSGIIAFSFTYIWASDILTFVMASAANGLKLVEETIRGHRRLIFWAILIAIVVTLLSSIWMVLHLAYTYGGVNTHRFFFIGAARYPFDNAAHRMDSPVGPNWAGWIYTGMGALIMALLMIARQRLLWWPFHPLGFPISPVFGTVFFSVFLAWLLKSVVLKYGGPKLYTKTRPFFLGLILGQFVSAGLWMVIDYFTGMTDNPVMNF